MRQDRMARNYEPTHLLDGKERVGKVRNAHHLLYMRNQPLRQIDRPRAARHGLYLVHLAEDQCDGFFGDLLVTGNRLSTIRT